MIPLSIPHIAGNEWKYVKECLDTGWISMAGAFVTQFEEVLAEYVDVKHGVAAVNGTCGLHMAMHVLNITRGDFVIVPNITFIASANAIAYTGAEPVFIDVDPDTWQMDLDLLESYLKEHVNSPNKPKAIMPVHVLGNMCDMDRLMDISKKYDIPLVEDATESLGTTYKGKAAGSFGLINVFSFNGNKIITTGGGGMIVTDDEALAVRAKHLTTQAKVNPETYYHDEIGFNYRMVNVLAAMGVAQMEQLASFVERKKYIDAYYREHLGEIEDIGFQKITEGVDPNCWLFTFKSSRQTELLAAFKESKIIARPFWMPMNQLPMFTEHVYVSDNDNSAEIHKKCLSIPCSVSITEEELAKVVGVIKSVYQHSEVV